MHDEILLPDLPLKAKVPGYAWSPGKISLQPLTAHFRIRTNVSQSAASDELESTVSYADLTKAVQKSIKEETEWKSLSDLALHLLQATKNHARPTMPPGWQLSVRLEQPKAFLQAKYAALEVSCTEDDAPNEEISIKDLQTSTVIGVNDHERKADQVVIVNFSAIPLPVWDKDFHPLYQLILDHLNGQHPLLIETMLQSLANKLLSKFPLQKVTLSLSKPSASRWAGAPTVSVTRSTTKPSKRTTRTSAEPSANQHRVFIAFGSNLGDKEEHIRTALNQLDQHPQCKLINTSFLYQSLPMYYLEQDDFLNGVAEISTSLSPQDLLAVLKTIEHDIGRRKKIDNGPREVDLDILLYDYLLLDDKEVNLKIPHMRLHEREFVLRPLADLIPDEKLPHLEATPAQLLSRFHCNSQLKRYLPRPLFLTKTTVMAIVNLTPDSFASKPHTPESSLALARQHVEEGATILDLGGMSTRPGAADISEEEELERVVPFVKLLRQQEWAKDITISIDTFRAVVARAALEAGADWINDVKAGRHDADGEMWKVARDTGAPTVLMHSRGTPQTMNSLAKYDAGLLRATAEELGASIEEALSHGVKRWQIIIDPGLGFAKDANANWQLLRNLREWRDHEQLAGLPCLLGSSRKRFLGTLLHGADPEARDVATAATLVEGVRAGVEVVRMHNAKAGNDAILVADQLYPRYA